ncbi:MAG: sugar ABC transporter permease [Sphaerochaetaceae bacterium]|nr:sugar ABC transporter permease [Sphaerochaetaceae bacterium]
MQKQKKTMRIGRHVVGKKEWYVPYLFLLPWIIGFIGLSLYPIVASLVFSFTQYNLFSEPVFSGFENYIYMFENDWHFPAAVKVTLLYVAVSVPLQLLVSLVLAFKLNKGIPFTTAFRTIFYIPSLLGSSVAVGILWRQLFSMNGLLNILLLKLGVHWVEGVSWIADPRFATWTIIILRVWQFGSPMIIFLAALRQVPGELLEAAMIDGAKQSACVRYIILPFISPIILFNLIMQTISAFKVFTEAFIVSGGASGGGIVGGTLDSLLFYTIHIYSEGFLKFRMGYASALAWLLLLIISIITLILFRISRKRVYYS